MKKLSLLFTLLLASNLYAGTIDDIFAPGDDQFQFERFSDEMVLVQIDQDANIACKDGLCTLHSVTNNYGGIEVSFQIGEGNTSNSGSGSVTNIYTGGNGNNIGDGTFWGFNIRYKRGNCTQTINVPRSVYYAINRYMYGLMTDTGGTRRGFTPADEAMIMFYTTIMDKASGCTMN